MIVVTFDLKAGTQTVENLGLSSDDEAVFQVFGKQIARELLSLRGLAKT